MANSDKNILITPSVGLSTNPTIKFNGANNTPTTLRVLDDGTVSFEGTAGQLFSISDGLTGSIFSVNDISGIPSIEVLDTGLVKINQYGGSTVYGASAAIQNGSLVNAKVSISTASATTPGLIIKGVSSQSANLQEWQNSSGTVITKIDANGAIDSTVQITGRSAVTAGTGNYLSASLNVVPLNASIVGAVIRGYASQTADLQQWQSSAGTALAKISSAGRLVIASDGEISSSQIFTSIAVAGGANVTTSSTANDYSIALNASGGVTGSTVGMAFQVWGGTGFNGIYQPGAGIWFTRTGGYSAGYLVFATRESSTPVTTVVERMRIGETGTISIAGFTASSQGLIIKAAASQTANLQEWQNSAGTVLVALDSAGNLSLPYNTLYASAVALNYLVNLANTNGYIQLSNGNVKVINRTTTSNNLLVVQGMSGQTGDLQQWQNSAGSVYSAVEASGKFFAQSISTNSTSNSAGVFLGDYNGGGYIRLKKATAGTATANNLTQYFLLDGTTTGTLKLTVQSSGALETILDNISTTGSVPTATISAAGMILTSPTASSIVAVVKGAASQTANLFETQDSSGNALVSLLATANSTNTLRFTDNFAFGINWGNNPVLYTAASPNTLIASPYSAARIGFIVKGLASQTADLQQWQNNAGTTLSKVDASGNITAPSYNLSDSKYLLRKTIKKTVDPAQNAVANNTYDLFDMNFSSSLQGTFYIQASIRGGGYGQNLTYSLPATYVMDWINQYAITNPFTNSTTWVDLTPLTFSPRHLMTNDYFKFQAKVNANQISFRIKLTGTLTGAPVFDIYIQHSEEFANSTITELNTTGTDATTSNVMPNFLSSKAGLSAIFNPITLYSNSASNIPLTIKGFASQSANLQEWQDSSANVIAKVDASGVTSVRSIRSANTIPNASVVDNTLYNLGVGPNASSYGISWLRVKSGYAGDIVSVFEGTTSQTGDLTQWKNSAGTLLAKVDSTGQITSNVQISSAISTPLVLQNSAFGVGTGTNITMNYGSGDYVKIESAYATSPGAGGAYLALKTNHNAGASATTKLLIDNQGTVTINGFVADAQGLIVKGAASQSVDLQQWQNSAGSVLAKVDASGYMGSIGVFSVNGAWSLEDAFGGSFAALKKTTSTVTNPGSDKARIYLVAGTTAGTLKLVVRAGASGAETTILDNIPQS